MEKMVFTEALIKVLSFVEDDVHISHEMAGFIYDGEERAYENFDEDYAECIKKAEKVLKGDFSTLTAKESRMVETFSHIYKSGFMTGSNYREAVCKYLYSE